MTTLFPFSPISMLYPFWRANNNHHHNNEDKQTTQHTHTLTTFSILILIIILYNMFHRKQKWNKRTKLVTIGFLGGNQCCIQCNDGGIIETRKVVRNNHFVDVKGRGGGWGGGGVDGDGGTDFFLIIQSGIGRTRLGSIDACSIRCPCEGKLIYRSIHWKHYDITFPWMESIETNGN